VTLTIAGSVFFAGLAAGRVDPRAVMFTIASLSFVLTVTWTIWRRALLRDWAPDATMPGA